MGGGRPVVHESIGSQVDQGVNLVGRGQADRPDPADLTHIAAHLVRVAHPDTHQLKIWMAHHLGDDHLADKAGTPYDDPFRRFHRSIISPERLIAPGLLRHPPGMGRVRSWLDRCPAADAWPQSTATGTSSKAPTSTRPLSVRRRSGITESPRKLMCMNGAPIDVPNVRAASTRWCNASATT